MYEIKIESEEFKEKRTVQQHQMVNQVSGSNSSPLPLAFGTLQGLPSGRGGFQSVFVESAGREESWPVFSD